MSEPDMSEPEMTPRARNWDQSYTDDTPPPWDIGEPQPTFARLADRGLLAGRLLDAGCGTGEHTLLAASCGADATGVDISPTAIGRARGKAAERGITARFEVANVLDPGQAGTGYDTVLDSGLFHVFNDADRIEYVAGLAAALRAGGTCYLMCFSDRQPGDVGPRRVTEAELRAAFAVGWEVTGIAADAFKLTINPWYETPSAHAWLATIRRL